MPGPAAMDDVPKPLRFDEFDLDEANARLTRAGAPVPLPPKAFAVLCELTRRPRQLTRKDALLDAVWGHRHVSESVLKTTVSQLRAALTDDPGQPRYIETVSRHGYRFIGSLVSPTNQIQAPARAPISTEGALIGRAAALARLYACWDRARAGERQLVWVAGEAGVGKSSLIRRFIADIGASRTVIGHCVEHFGSGEPYLPLLEILRELCAREPGLPALMRAVAPTWIIQMPWLISESDRGALHRELAGAHPDRMVRELRELLTRIAAAEPMVLVTEDLHWSDPGTLRMMEHYARQPRAVPLLWIASFRLAQVIAEDHPLAELRHELRVQGLCEEILLDPFSESEVSAYLRARLPNNEIHETFVRRIHDHTEGLPLFVANVVDNLQSQAANDSTVGAAWTQAESGAPLPVPESLSGVIEKQIRRLPLELQSLLTAASVCGKEFRSGIVSTLVERDPAWVREACDHLVARQTWLQHVGIVERPGGDFEQRYTFAHSLYQRVFYQRLAASQRVQYHRLAARAIAQTRTRGEEAAAMELASHYERGHESLPAMRAYAEAAQSALGRFDPRVAGQLSAHGLLLLDRCPDSPERKDVELDLLRPGGVAASLLFGVASEQARAAFGRIRELCDVLPQTPERALALNGMGWFYYVRGEYDQALALAVQLEELSTRFNDPVLLVFACNLCGVALIAQGKLRDGCDYLERGINQCLRIGERMPLTAFVIDPEVSMRANLAFPLIERGYADQAREHLRLGTERAERIRQPIAIMLVHWAGGMCDVRLEKSEGVARHVTALTAIVEQDMLSQGEGPSLWLRGWVEAQRGEPRIGHDRIIQGYHRHARLGMYAGCPEVLGYAVEALILDKDWQGAQRQLNQALSLAAQICERLAVPRLLLLQARIALGLKNRAAARGALLASIQEARAQEALGTELHALVALSEIKSARGGELDELDRAYRALKEGLDLPIYRRAGELVAQRQT